MAAGWVGGCHWLGGWLVGWLVGAGAIWGGEPLKNRATRVQSPSSARCLVARGEGITAGQTVGVALLASIGESESAYRARSWSRSF